MIHAQNSKQVLLLAPQAVTYGATATARLDTMGYDYATIRVALGARLNTNAVAPTISVVENDTTATSSTTITADRSESCQYSHELVYQIDTRARKRYLRVNITPGTASNDTVTTAILATLSRAERAPANTYAMVNTTNDAVVVP